jgi:hypothetical protein
VDSITEFRQAIQLFEELMLHRRDLFSRLDRKVREKISPPVRDILRARRERQQRHRRHRLTNLETGPEKRLSSRLRFR